MLCVSTEETVLIGGLLKFSLAKNYNIAFSLPVLSGTALLLFNGAITIVLAYYAIREFFINKKKLSFALFMIVAGSVSNLIDRTIHGFVVDYLDLRYFTVFNLADGLIVIGAFLSAFYLFRHSERFA